MRLPSAVGCSSAASPGRPPPGAQGSPDDLLCDPGYAPNPSGLQGLSPHLFPKALGLVGLKARPPSDDPCLVSSCRSRATRSGGK